MSDMTPKEAQDYLKNASILGIAHHERRALETVAGMKSRYRIEVTRMIDGTGGYWQIGGSWNTLEECEEFMRVNQQLQAIPNEFKRITVRHHTDWQVIDNA